jgi:hypothetical protein
VSGVLGVGCGSCGQLHLRAQLQHMQQQLVPACMAISIALFPVSQALCPLLRCAAVRRSTTC